MKSIKVFAYSRSRSFDDDLILQGKASGERSQDQWSSGLYFSPIRQAYPFVCLSEIKRMYDEVEAETRKSQASFQIIQVSSEALPRKRLE